MTPSFCYHYFTQGLGMHMNYGGGLGGFIATRDEKEFELGFP